VKLSSDSSDDSGIWGICDVLGGFVAMFWTLLSVEGRGLRCLCRLLVREARVCLGVDVCVGKEKE
jgi:hypothetical protein